MTKKQNKEYFMGHHPLDNWRLERKVDPKKFVLTFIDQYLEKETVALEIGCGPGTIAKYIGNHYHDVNLTVIDKSLEKISTTHSNTMDLKKIKTVGGDIYKLPFKDNSYDFIFCRLLFQYLKNPQAAVNEMVRVCKKNGSIMVQDLDGQLLTHFPEQKEFQDQIEKVSKLIAKRQGFDPYIGRKLYSFFKKAGLEKIQVKINEYHNIMGKIDEKNKILWNAKLELALPELRQALGCIIKAEQLKKDYMNYLMDENTCTFSLMMTVYGKKQ